MNATTKTKALDALEGMRQIVDAEMLVHGQYFTDDVDPLKAANVCGGRKYCAIGSLWAGAGVPIKRMVEKDPDGDWDYLALPGVEQEDREGFLRRRPALRAAYNALNDAAFSYALKHGLTNKMRPKAEFEAPVEALFESRKVTIGRNELLEIIASAKRKVKAA